MADSGVKSRFQTDLNLKHFRLPCLLKYDDLMDKFSGTLEINFRDKDQVSNGYGKVSPIECESTSNKRSLRWDDGNVTKRRNSRSSSSSHASIDADLVKEVKFKTPRSIGFKTTPRRRTINNNHITANQENQKANQTTTKSQKGRLKQNEENDIPKPGAKGSRQEINAPARNRSGTVRQPQSKIIAQHVFGGLRIRPPNDIIDTKNFVDEALIAFLPEICQRAKMDSQPKDPMDICRKFSLIVPDLNLSDEIECVDMTGD